MVQRKFTNLNKPKIFIWQGQWTGGAESVTYKVAEILSTKFNADITLGVYKGYKNDQIKLTQIEALPLFSNKVIGYSAVISSLYLRLKGILNEYDIVFTHTGGFWKTRKSFFVRHEAVSLDKFITNLPFLSKLIAYPSMQINKFSLQKADLVFAATNEATRYLKSINVTNILPTSSFFDEKIFKQVSKIDFKPSEKFRILFVGRPNDKVKNFDSLLNAVKNLKNVKLISTGNYIKAESVKYIGEVDKERINKEMQRSHLLVLPSFSEGFPLVILEALAVGLPVLTTRNAAPDEIKKYVNLTSPEPASIRKKLTHIVGHYDTYKKKAIAATKIIRVRYNSNVVITNECQKLLQKWNEKKS